MNCHVENIFCIYLMNSQSFLIMSILSRLSPAHPSTLQVKVIAIYGVCDRLQFSQPQLESLLQPD